MARGEHQQIMNRFSRFLDGFSRLFERKELFINRADVPQSIFGKYRYGYDPLKALYANVVMAPVMWAMRTFTEASAMVERKNGKLWNEVPDHELAALIDTPNDFYDGDALWKGTVLSYMLEGNAYWLKVRNTYGDVIQLWYIPHWQIQPIWPLDGRNFIDYYQYVPNGAAGSGYGSPIPLPVRDVVHLRFGLDPMNPRLGVSPLRAMLQEVFTDTEAAQFSEVVLKNMGIPGLMISPKDSNVRVTPTQVAELKKEVEDAFTSENRGKTFVMGAATEVSQFGFDPNKLMLANIRDIAEERVCAILGIPAAVVGFGAGLQSTKVGATMRELVRLAWVQCMNPMQNSFGRQLTHQILPDFQSQTARFRVRFDASDVSVFQEEQNLTADRVRQSVLAGLLRVDRGQGMLGLEVDETQKVYLRPTNTIAVGPDAEPDPSRNFPEGGDPGAGAPQGEADTQKMLAAIANRVNGNGKH